MAHLLEVEKIFIDSDEEITFIASKVSKAKKSNVLLIVPPNAQIFTNLITLKTLQRGCIAEGKAMILVTEDKYGSILAQKAGIICVTKVSQVTTDLWEITNEKMFSNKAKLEDIREENLHEKSTEITFEEEELLKEEVKTEETDEMEGFVADDKVGNDESFVEEEKLLDFGNKKENIVKIKGISLMVGGDIESVKKNAHNVKINNSDKFKEDNMEFKERQINKDVLSTGSFTGKDFTKATKVRSSGILSKLFKGKSGNPEDRFQESEMDKKTRMLRRNRIIAIAGIVFGLFLIISFLAINSWAEVKFRVVLRKEEKLASVSVQADLEIDEVDIEQGLVPALKLETEMASTSSTTDATGRGVKGVKSKGTIYIVNGTAQEITLPANTTVTEEKTLRQYLITQETVVKAGSRSSDNTITSATTSKIPVEAAGFGEEYNLSTAASYTLSVTGLDSNGSFTVSLETSIVGGTKQEFVAVDPANVDALKTKILPGLEDKIKRDLRLQVPAGFILIEESIQLQEPKLTAKPAIGEEVTNGTFDLTIESKATGIMVREADLKKLIEESIKAEGGSSLSTINKIDGITVSEFVENNTGIFFLINAQSDLTNHLDENNIRELIKGKSLDNAKQIISNLEDVQLVEEVIYSPDLIPEAFRIVPRSNGNIEFDIK